MLSLLIIIYFPFFIEVTCGLCNNNMQFKEYTENHKATHYNLCWIIGDEKVVS